MTALLLALVMACAQADDTVDSAGSGDTAAPQGDAVGCTETGTGSSPLELEGDITCGAQVFTDHCTHCHGAQGQGTDVGPDLGSHVPAHTDEELVYVIVAGSGDMPPQGLAPQQTADVLAWLRDRFGEFNGEGH